jgi:hypothetical protein
MGVDGFANFQTSWNLQKEKGYYITLNNIQAAAFILAHEMGHRAGILNEDNHDQFGFASIFNNSTVRNACFDDAAVWEGPLPE